MANEPYDFRGFLSAQEEEDRYDQNPVEYQFDFEEEDTRPSFSFRSSEPVFNAITDIDRYSFEQEEKYAADAMIFQGEVTQGPTLIERIGRNISDFGEGAGISFVEETVNTIPFLLEEAVNLSNTLVSFGQSNVNISGRLPRLDIGEAPPTTAGQIGETTGVVGSILATGGTTSALVKAPKLIRSVLIRGGVTNTAKLNRYTAALSSFAAGEIGAQLVLDPNDPLVANIIEEYSPAIAPYIEPLASDPNDPEAINRLRLLVEGGLFGLTFAGVHNIVSRFNKRFIDSVPESQIKEYERELASVTESDATKLYALEERLVSDYGLNPEEIIPVVREEYLNGISIDDISRQLVGEDGSTVISKVFESDPVAQKRILLRKVLENPRTDPVVNFNLSRSENIDDFILDYTGDTGDNIVARATSEETFPDLAPLTREEAERNNRSISGITKQFITKAIRGSGAISRTQRELIGFSEDPVEIIKKARSGKDLEGFLPKAETERLDRVLKEAGRKEFNRQISIHLERLPGAVSALKPNTITAHSASFLNPGDSFRPVLPSNVETITEGLQVLDNVKSLGNIVNDLNIKSDELEEFIEYIRVERVKLNEKRGIVNIARSGEGWDELLEKGRADTRYQQFAEEFGNLMKAALLYQVRSGRLSRQEYVKFITANTDDQGRYFFAPLYADPAALTNAKGAAGKAVGRFAQIKGNYGVELEQATQSVFRYVTKGITAAQNNRERQALFNLVDTLAEDGNRSASLIAEKVNLRALAKNSAFRNELKDRLKAIVREANELGDTVEQGGDLIPRIDSAKGDDFNSLAEQILREYTYDHKLAIGGENYEVVFRDGRASYYKINDEAVAEYLASTRGPARYLFTENLRTAKFFQDTAEGYTNLFGRLITKDPKFALGVNPLRDTISAAFNSPFGFVPFVSSGKGLASLLFSKEQVREAISGGLMGGLRVTNIGQRSNTYVEQAMRGIDPGLADLGQSKTAVQSILGTIKTAYDKTGYEQLITAVETASRQGEYLLARKHGFSPSYAALAGNEVSVNFAHRPTNKVINTLDSYTAFLNASLQGFGRTLRTVKNKRASQVATVLVPLITAELAFDELSGLYEEYQGLNTQDKSLYSFIPNTDLLALGNVIANAETRDDIISKLPPLDKDQPFFAFPTPHDIGAIAKTISSTIEYAVGDQATKKELFAGYQRLILSVTGGFTGLPTPLHPFTETFVTNTDNYGNPVLPDYYKGDKYRYSPSTLDTAVQLANLSEYLNTLFLGIEEPMLHPMQIDHLMKSMLPGAGSLALNIVEETVRDEERRGERPLARSGTKTDSANPAVFFLQGFEDRFTVSRDELGKYAANLYKLKDEATSLKASKRNLSKKAFTNQIDIRILNAEVEDIDGTKTLMYKAYPILNVFDQARRGFDLQIQKVSNDPALTGEEKTRRITALNDRRFQLYSSLNEYLVKLDPDTLTDLLGEFRATTLFGPKDGR